MKSITTLMAATAVVVCTTFAQPPAALETEVLLNAADLLPAEVMRGTSHRVRDHVATDGYLAHFEIDSDFGLFTAAGVPEARRRIAECDAIRVLVETSKSDLFAEGIKRSLTQPIEAVKNIVEQPVESVKQVPKTVGHFFSKVGSAIERGASRVAGNGETSPASPRQVGAGIGNAAKSVAGFDKAKLETARQLGIDPYSDNARLQEEMDKVTWAFFAGGLPLRVGVAVASAGASTALTVTKAVGIPEELYALTPAELALRNQQSLEAGGVDQETLTAFQIHPSLTITQRRHIVRLLEALPNAQNKPSMIGLANACETSAQADFLIKALAILAEQQASGAADYASLKVVGRLPGATTATGDIHVPAPVDHVTWTDTVAAFASRDDLGAQPKVLVHTGNLSPVASAGFTAAGWKIIAIGYPNR